MNDRFRYGLLGLVYGVLFWFWAALMTGGGHYNIPILWANPLAFIYWPIVCALAANLTGKGSRLAFLFALGLHYLYIFWYLLNPEAVESDWYWYTVGGRERSKFFFLFPPPAVLPFALGQFFLWRRFLRSQSHQLVRSTCDPQ